jgi:hypothetical protein
MLIAESDESFKARMKQTYLPLGEFIAESDISRLRKIIRRDDCDKIRARCKQQLKSSTDI